jgi:hypothetical protein
MKRWYDKHRKLGKLLDNFKGMRKYKRDKLATGIIGIIKEHDGMLIDDKVMEFPLDLPQRRWYDKDPYLWLIFNGLSQADKKLLKNVTAYLEKQIT